MHQLWSCINYEAIPWDITFLRWSEAQASFFLHRCASQHPHVCAIEAAPNQYNSHANLCQLMTSQLLVQKDLAILAKRKYLTRWLKITSEQSMSVGFLWWGRPRNQSQNGNAVMIASHSPPSRRPSQAFQQWGPSPLQPTNMWPDKASSGTSTSYSTRAPQTTPHPQHHKHHLSTIAIPPVQQHLDQLWHFVRTKRSTNRSTNLGTAQMLGWRVGVPEFGALS